LGDPFDFDDERPTGTVAEFGDIKAVVAADQMLEAMGPMNMSLSPVEV
jgi:hypothetical protein